MDLKTYSLCKIAVSAATDVLSGGKAQGKTPSDFNPKALAKGTKVELEHTSNRAVAREIAMDHLAEDPKYYDKLELIEKKAMSVKKVPWGQRLGRILGKGGRRGAGQRMMGGKMMTEGK